MECRAIATMDYSWGGAASQQRLIGARRAGDVGLRGGASSGSLILEEQRDGSLHVLLDGALGDPVAPAPRTPQKPLPFGGHFYAALLPMQKSRPVLTQLWYPGQPPGGF